MDRNQLIEILRDKISATEYENEVYGTCADLDGIEDAADAILALLPPPVEGESEEVETDFRELIISSLHNKEKQKTGQWLGYWVMGSSDLHLIYIKLLKLFLAKQDEINQAKKAISEMDKIEELKAENARLKEENEKLKEENAESKKFNSSLSETWDNPKDSVWDKAQLPQVQQPQQWPWIMVDQELPYEEQVSGEGTCSEEVLLQIQDKQWGGFEVVTAYISGGTWFRSDTGNVIDLESYKPIQWAEIPTAPTPQPAKEDRPI